MDEAWTQVERLKHPEQNLREAFKVPILINDRMHYSIKKHRLHLLRQQVYQRMHTVDLLFIFDVNLAPLRQQLLANQSHEISQISILGQFFVLCWAVEATFDFGCQ